MSLRRLSPLLWTSAALALAVGMGGLRDPGRAATFTIIFWGMVFFVEGGVRFSRGGLWTALAAWTLLSALMNPSAGPAALAVSARFWLAAAFFACAASAHGFARSAGVVTALAGAAGAAAVYYQALAGLPLSGMIPPNPNYTAALAGAGASLLMVAGAAGKGRSRWLLWGGALLMAGAVALLNSRGAALAGWAALTWAFFSSGRRRAGYAVLLAPLLLAVLLPQEVIYSFLKAGDANAYRRLDIWSTAAAAFAERPLSGWGPGSFRYAFEALKFPAFNGVSFFGHSTVHAHSEPLQLLAETGLPGAALYLSAFWVSFRRSARSVLAVPALFLFVHSCVDGIFYAWGLQLLMLACLAGAEGALRPVEEDRPVLFPTSPELLRARFVYVLPALAAAALAAFSWQWMHRQGRDVACAMSGKWDAESRLECAGRAIRFSPYREALHLVRAEQLAAWSGSAAAGPAAAEAGLERLPLSAMLNYRAAGFYAAAGAGVKAEEKLRRALYLEPNFARARLALAEVLGSSGRRAAAAAEISAARAAAALAPYSRSPYDRAMTQAPPGP
ncbi:MAG: O-antigen ligase family protein [Elusimicrobiales bacterium]|nr:O-antigen ligase family protein [Elusimicrobiales bacterium]